MFTGGNAVMKPIIGIDCPDNDVIRVDDEYYRVVHPCTFARAVR